MLNVVVTVPAAELQSPLPHRLMADEDAARCQHLLDHPQAQRIPEVQPDNVGAQSPGWWWLGGRAGIEAAR